MEGKNGVSWQYTSDLNAKAGSDFFRIDNRDNKLDVFNFSLLRKDDLLKTDILKDEELTQEKVTMELESMKKKRRRKMHRHKYRKRLKRERFMERAASN